MGSIDKACISGFLCRLCSEMHRIVIHIYGDQGKRLSLVEKINGYLPITISPTDPLPKTICETCLRRVEQHYDLLVRLSRIKEERFSRMKRTIVNTEEVSDMSGDELCSSDEEIRIQSNVPSTPLTTELTPSTSSAVNSNADAHSVPSVSNVTTVASNLPLIQLTPTASNRPLGELEHND